MLVTHRIEWPTAWRKLSTWLTSYILHTDTAVGCWSSSFLRMLLGSCSHHRDVGYFYVLVYGCYVYRAAPCNFHFQLFRTDIGVPSIATSVCMCVCTYVCGELRLSPSFWLMLILPCRPSELLIAIERVCLTFPLHLCHFSWRKTWFASQFLFPLFRFPYFLDSQRSCCIVGSCGNRNMCHTIWTCANTRIELYLSYVCVIVYLYQLRFLYQIFVCSCCDTIVTFGVLCLFFKRKIIYKLTRMWADAQLGSHSLRTVPTAAMSSSDWPEKPTHKIEHRVASCHAAEVISIRTFTFPSPCPKGTTDLSRWQWDVRHIWYGRRILATDWPYCFRFSDFPRIICGMVGLKLSTLGPQIRQNWGFRPSDV